MAEASKNSNKPVTTAAFLQQLQQQKPAATEEKQQNETKAVESKPMTNALQALQGESSTNNSMEGLSDSDLQTLLQNFKDLSTTEQHDLITYLKKLESKEPDRVERLRKFVTLGQEGEKIQEKKETGRLSPFSNRLNDGNPMVEQEKLAEYEDFDVLEKKKAEEEVKEKRMEKINIDSDEEDYSFEDVFKAAKKNLKEKEEEKERLKEETTKKNTDVDLKDAKAIIASLMSTVSVNKTSFATASSSLNTVPVNIDSLTNMVGSLRNFMEPTPSGQPLPRVTPAPVPVPQQQQPPNVPYVQYPIRNQPSYSNNYGYPQRQTVQYPLPPANPQNRMPYGFNNPRAPNPAYNNGNPQGPPGNYGNRW